MLARNIVSNCRSKLTFHFGSRFESTSLAERVRKSATGEDQQDIDAAERSARELDESGEPFRRIYLKPNRLPPMQTKLQKIVDKRNRKPSNAVYDFIRSERCSTLSTESDWPSIWPTATSFKASVVPLPVRMGHTKLGSKIPPRDKHCNLELVKVPNFLHLTPRHIERHCEAIKKFCTDWPIGLDNDDDCLIHFPLRVRFSDYVHAGTSLRDMRSRIVTFSFQLRSTFNLNDHAFEKFVRLCGDKYEEKSDTVTITADRCYTRKQNLDYLFYLLTALYRESNKVENWEQSKCRADDLKVFFKGSTGEKAIFQLMNSTAKNDKSPVYSLFSDLPSDFTLEQMSDHPTVRRYNSVWELYRNEPETVQTARLYGEAVRDLLAIPPIENVDKS